MRLTDVEFITHRDMTTTPEMDPTTENLINKTGSELLCQPAASVIERRSQIDDAAIERGSQLDQDYGRSLWQALS